MKSIFNPTPETILSSSRKRIVFIHVGKCAGESIVEFLEQTLDDRFALFELHVAQANKAFDLLSQNCGEGIKFLIAKRDPLQRYVSAFNWDKHNLYLKGALSGNPAEEWFRMFPNVNELGLGLSAANAETRQAATNFSRFAHMGMGQSWYTSVQSLLRIPDQALSTVDVATLEEDLIRFLEQQLQMNRKDLPELRHSKADYQDLYERPEDLFSKDLSAVAKENLTLRIREDYVVYGWLSALASRAKQN